MYCTFFLRNYSGDFKTFHLVSLFVDILEYRLDNGVLRTPYWQMTI